MYVCCMFVSRNAGLESRVGRICVRYCPLIGSSNQFKKLSLKPEKFNYIAVVLSQGVQAERNPPLWSWARFF